MVCWSVNIALPSRARTSSLCSRRTKGLPSRQVTEMLEYQGARLGPRNGGQSLPHRHRFGWGLLWLLVGWAHGQGRPEEAFANTSPPKTETHSPADQEPQEAPPKTMSMREALAAITRAKTRALVFEHLGHWRLGSS